MRKTLVAFDLDDTLFKECHYVLSGRKAVAEFFASKVGIPANKLYEIIEKYAPTDRRAFDKLVELGIDIQDILKVYRSHFPDISLSDETLHTLAKLKSQGLYLCLITDGRSDSQRKKIKALGLDKFFPENSIFISEEIGGDKTTSKPFIEAENRFHDAERKIYVGDNPSKDFYYPRKMGWTAVMLQDKKGENIFPQCLEAFNADYWPDIEISNIDDIVKLTEN